MSDPPARDGPYVAVALLFWLCVLVLPRIFSSESFPEALAKLRFEDLLAPLLLAYLIPRRRALAGIVGRRVALFAGLWIAFVVAATLLNAIGRRYPLWVGAAFAGKEVEYLLFFAFFAVFASRNPRWTMAAIAVPALVIFGTVAWQVAFGFQGYYGVAMPFEYGTASPAEAGGISAILFVVFLAAALHARSFSPRRHAAWAGLSFAFAAAAGATLALTLSRTNILAALAAAGVLVLIVTLRAKRPLLVLCALGGAIALALLAFSFLPLHDRLMGRFMAAGREIWIRVDDWGHLLGFLTATGDPFAVLFGLGLGSPTIMLGQSFGALGLGVDSQIVRRLFEVGLVGTALWVWLMVATGQRVVGAARGGLFSRYSRALVASLGVLALIASLAIEWLQVARIASAFYAFAGVLMGVAWRTGHEAFAKGTAPKPVARGRAPVGPTPFVTVVVPARDEEAFIGPCLESIVANGYPHDRMEVLVLDGMSTDRTPAILAEWSARHPMIRRVPNERRTIPVALNMGIARARGDVIVRVDAHSRIEPGYIRTGVEALEVFGVDVVGGVMRTVPRDGGRVGEAIVECISHPFGVGGSHFRTQPTKPMLVDAIFNGCYRKDVFRRIGSYRVGMERTEDLELNQRLRRAGGRLLLLPTMQSTYHARSDLKSFVRHNWLNGEWAVLPLLHVETMPVSWRHLVPLSFVCALLLGAGAAMAGPQGLWVLAAVGGPYLAVNAAASVHVAWRRRKPTLAPPMLLAFAAFHVPYGLGSLWALVTLPVRSLRMRARRPKALRAAGPRDERAREAEHSRRDG